MAHAKKKIFAALRLLTILALFGVAGHFAGRQAARAGLFHATRREAVSGDHNPNIDPNIEVPERSRPAPVDRDRLAVAMNRLKALMLRSPELALDWEGQEDLRKLLEDLSPEELAEMYADIPLPADRILAMKIGGFWAEKDPAGALKAALDRGHGSLQWAIGIFGEWGRSQPAAALAWLESGEVPEELKGSKGRMYEEILSGSDLLERDFPLATGCIVKMSEKDAAQILSHWGSAYAGDPGMRDQLIAFARSSARPMDYAVLNANIVAAWPQDDPVTMMNYLIGLKDYLEASPASPAIQVQVDAAAVGSAVMREYDRSALEWWMDRHASSTEVPQVLASALNQWARRYPEKAAQWFAEQPPSPQVDAMHGSLANGFIGAHAFDKAVEQISGIGDESVRQDAIERLNYQWSQAEPENAAKWRAAHPELFPAGNS